MIAVMAMMILLISPQAVASGGRAGIELCLYTVVPALFPFFVISGIVNRTFAGKPIPLLRPLGRLCGVPVGCEALLLLGLVGGYPVGAKAIADAYRCGNISRSSAQKLLRFCNNTGPSFIFGLIAPYFSSPAIGWCIWCVHILSAILVGIATQPQADTASPLILPTSSGVLENSLKSIGVVCGYVILFRCGIDILSRWLPQTGSATVRVVLLGLLELTNGCCQLPVIQDEVVRFIVAGCLLSAGGLCVLMQTSAVTGTLGIRSYVKGKALQIPISLSLSAIFQYFIFPAEQILPIWASICAALALTAYILWMRLKKQ